MTTMGSSGTKSKQIAMVEPKEAKHLVNGDHAIARMLDDNEENNVDNGGMIEFLRHLPTNVKRRVRYLKRLQMEAIVELEVEFYRAIHELEIQFGARFAALHAKRMSVIIGDYEPTNQEADYPLVHGLSDEQQKMFDVENGGESDGDVRGVPHFWLTVLKHVDMCGEMIEEWDEPILEHLVDVSVDVYGGPKPGFKLTFHFTPNAYFDNTTLTKSYDLQLHADANDPFEYDGPQIIGCTGYMILSRFDVIFRCKIDWKEGKKVTAKVAKKKQKHKSTGVTRFVTKEVKVKSFFNFFDVPVNVTESDDELNDETRELLHRDFEIGQAFRDRIIPRAVLCYTGEALDDNDYYGDGEEDDDEDDEDESHEDDEEEDN